MNGKIMSLAIVFAMVIGSFGAVGTQNENDCACGSITSSSFVTDGSGDYYAGLVEPDNWRDGAPFDPSENNQRLPSSFDWREESDIGLPPIRNQGSCGSCWAFGTIASLECNMWIKDNVQVDLSEQWLVSCNRDTTNGVPWGCAGGWFAHKYLTKNGKTDQCGETGAITEDAFPYTANDDPCGCPHNSKRYFIESWSYIGDGNGVPTSGQIKDKIYNYGPVSVAVCVNNAFHDYDGGIFSGPSCSSINHAVALVGWNDNGGYWILRNSWGTGWGENGYMRIAYGTNNVGYAACYVEYEASCEKLKCGGNLIFDPAAVDTPCTGSFTVENTHPDEYNCLNWKVDTSIFPDDWLWRVWPGGDTCLRPIDGETTVSVTIEVPSRSRVRKLSGDLKVFNVDNPDDYELIGIYLTTPRGRHFSNPLVQRFFDDFPILRNLFSNFFEYFNRNVMS